MGWTLLIPSKGREAVRSLEGKTKNTGSGRIPQGKWTGQGRALAQARWGLPLASPTKSQGQVLLSLGSSPCPSPRNPAALSGEGQGHTRVDGLVAGEVALVAEGGLAAVTLVGFVAVGLQRVPLERGLLREAAVTLIAEEGPVLCQRVEGHHISPRSGNGL